ncbi:MFS transporter [Klebsiella sp. WOUb02]|uniref:MFS transporter n=1 Tax=Klebsiella sp. WOUb02 TaxID=3161071 RepID=UPI003CF34B61
MTFSQNKSFWLITGGALVLFLSLGIRHGFGLFLHPMSAEFGWGREVFAFAMAIQNIIWGVAQPFAGALADRFGTRRTIITGAIFYTSGLMLMGFAHTPLLFSLSAGLLIGIGLSGTSFSVILGAIGRTVPAEKRSMAMGLTAAAGSFGQFAMLPGSMVLIHGLGWASALIALGMVAMLMLPAAALFQRQETAPSEPHQTMSEALREALEHSGFWLLSLGFFVCGFQVVFIGVHLPSYLMDNHLPVIAGTSTLALVGLFNVFGTYFAGMLGSRYSKTKLLSLIYIARAVIITLFISFPVTTWSAYCFGIAMGLLWLSTVPLTNGTVATMFGVRNLSMLGGIIFLMHQAGAFLGGWLGGYLYDVTGSYSIVWYVSIVLSVIAAALNWPIREVSKRALTGLKV